MGFRSVFITEDIAISWPEWFVEKWSQYVHFHEATGPISSKYELKTYNKWKDLEEDVQKIIGGGFTDKIIMVYLHECRGITRVEIYKDKILYSVPETWRVTQYIGHDECYGCSDITEQ